jgi:hypothetical protein
MKGAIEKALKDLDGLGERAVRTRILGIEDEEPKEEPELAAASEDEDEEEEMDPELKAKLVELLGQE